MRPRRSRVRTSSYTIGPAMTPGATWRPPRWGASSSAGRQGRPLGRARHRRRPARGSRPGRGSRRRQGRAGRSPCPRRPAPRPCARARSSCTATGPTSPDVPVTSTRATALSCMPTPWIMPSAVKAAQGLAAPAPSPIRVAGAGEAVRLARLGRAAHGLRVPRRARVDVGDVDRRRRDVDQDLDRTGDRHGHVIATARLVQAAMAKEVPAAHGSGDRRVGGGSLLVWWAASRRSRSRRGIDDDLARHPVVGTARGVRRRGSRVRKG